MEIENMVVPTNHAFGQLHKSEVPREAYPHYFAAADRVGGTVEPFDQYQGPYILVNGQRIFMSSEDGFMGRWWNEQTDEVSDWFPCGSGKEIECLYATEAIGDVVAVGEG